MSLFIQCITKTESDHRLFWNDLDTRGLLINHPFHCHMGSTSGAADQNFGGHFFKRMKKTLSSSYWDTSLLRISGRVYVKEAMIECT